MEEEIKNQQLQKEDLTVPEKEDDSVSLDLEAEDSDGEDSELPPPEDQNDARSPNTGYMIGAGMAVILLILIIVLIGTSFRKKDKKKQPSDELEKAGIKTVIEFKDKTSVENNSTAETVIKSEKEIEEVIEELPLEFQLPSQGEVGTAPITPAGAAVSSVYDRPDTRNSKSPRKIEGLAGQNYSTGNTFNSNSISQYLNGSYGAGTGSAKLSKEEFIAQQMAQTRDLQNSLSGTGAGNPSGTYGGNKENFFMNGMNNSGRGEYLNTSTLWDGTIISAALVTAINTDNPGVVIARVTENVYSSQDHSYLLIPEGTQLMATYNSSVSYGQNRVQVAWNLMIRPDNYRIQLGNMNGVSPQGESGYKGSVSNHPFQTMLGLGLVAVYSVIQTEVAGTINTQDNEYLKNSLTDVYSEASRIGNKIVDRALDIKPTITIKAGTEIKLITNTPLELPPVEMFSPNQKYIRKNR